MKIAIVGGTSTDTDPQTNYIQAFKTVYPKAIFEEIRFDYLVIEISKLQFEIYDWRTKTHLADYDFVIFRGKIRRNSELAYAVSRYLIYKKTPFFNDYSNYRPSSKLAQAISFFELGIPFIPTYYSINKTYLSEIGISRLEFPFIIKDNFGSHGDKNFIVKKSIELQKIITDNIQVKFLIQEFCPNDCDYRILILGDEKPLIIKRTAVIGSHLNNTSQGAVAELQSDLPEAVVNNAHKIASALNMTLAGVDVLQNSQTGEYYFLEVNSQPQLVSGAFIPEKLRRLGKLFKL
ncbi:ATP-grasp domain-containing protein [Candidatus Nomurabacteria bacterium]|jgi:glutathione synthase/RimK-type ligase-like ATP-grasp enzyme|nr:ATP-grasp domain-containing protein [Candidatus Saccharibacteria bacterium]MCA9350459.1 ATP-grasp domain-containing protein [Candidatus Saccharibacteria bacterium]MCB9839424.1 ATP-grasp domain-containing protein [Candidatus Nomurabacteria bacterium]